MKNKMTAGFRPALALVAWRGNLYKFHSSPTATYKFFHGENMTKPSYRIISTSTINSFRRTSTSRTNKEKNTESGSQFKQQTPHHDGSVATSTPSSTSSSNEQANSQSYILGNPRIEKLNHIMSLYEDFVGLTEVKHAQDKVVGAEAQFLKVQEDRRSMQQELMSIQAEVRNLGAELEKTNRTDSKYIDLVKKEHEILLIEKGMSNKIKTLDKAERDFFSLLSAAVRESHEKERARAEKTKYWSIIGSVIGAMIGIVGSTVNNHRRMTQLKAIVTESGDSTAEYKAMTEKLLKTFSANSGHNFEADVQNVHSQISVIEKDEIVNCIQKQSDSMALQLKEIHNIIGAHLANSSNTFDCNSNNNNSGADVVYVGPNIQTMLQKTELTIEKSLKENSVITTAAMSGVFSVGVLLIIYMLRGTP